MFGPRKSANGKGHGDSWLPALEREPGQVVSSRVQGVGEGSVANCGSKYRCVS